MKKTNVKNVVLIGDSGDMKLPESHPKEYGKVSLVYDKAAVAVPNKYIGAVPERGVIFVKHPYMDCYVAHNDELAYNICAAMIGDLSIFAQELGAKRISFSITISSKRFFSNKTEISVSNGINRNGNKKDEKNKDENNQGSAKEEYKKERKAFAKLSEERVFDRTDPILSEEEYRIAQKHFNDSALFKYCDPLRTAESMLMGRDPCAKTKCKKKTIRIEKNMNLNDELAVAASFKKASILKAKGSYTQNRKFSKHIKIQMDVSFV